MLIWETRETDQGNVERLAMHALGTAECFRRVDNQGSLILCEQGRAPEDVSERRATRVLASGRFGPEAGPWIFVVAIRAPEDWREEVCAWYQCEHGPMLLECPDWQGFQLLESTTEAGCQLHALHRLADRAALDSEERKRSRATPWFKRLATNNWFDGPFERVLAHRLSLLWNPPK